MAEDVRPKATNMILASSKQGHLLVCICKLRLLPTRWCRCGRMCEYGTESFLLQVWLEVVSIRCDRRRHVSVRHGCGILTFLWSDIANRTSRRGCIRRYFARWSWRSMTSGNRCLTSEKLLQCSRHTREMERRILARQHLRWSMQLLRESHQSVRIVVSSPFTMARLRTV